ncbi:MAG: ATP synthase F1 subunit epsilon [Myxococcales bacterium]|nr:ATP synthase F1 subunit epsilon [Myxococcales bacterium]
MAGSLHIEVVTPERQVLSEDVAAVTMPGNLGEMAVMPLHRPLLTSLRPGRFVVKTDAGERVYYLGGGFAEILPDRVTVLADACEAADKIDTDEAAEQLKKAQEDLDSKKGRSLEENEKEILALERAKARASVAGEKAGAH